MDGCEVISNSDFNGDGAVDLSDFGNFATGLNGPNNTPGPDNPECNTTYLNAFDLDGDGDIDLADFSLLQSLLATGV